MKRNVRTIAVLCFTALLLVTVHSTNRFVVEEQEKNDQLVSGISNYYVELLDETTVALAAETEESKVTICENETPTCANHPDCEESTIEDKEKNYTEEDVDLLARVIFAECGSDWVDDLTLYYVGSVVLNRVASEICPDTLQGVIYQKGQYECTWNGHLLKDPTERCYTIAEDLLENGSILPEDVLYQAEFVQGAVYDYRCGLYFCYV